VHDAGRTGMKVRTESEKLRQLRRACVELYVSDHPLNCAAVPPTRIANCRVSPRDLGVTTSPYGFEGANHSGCPLR
jgi:formate dehydrogenase major subunit